MGDRSGVMASRENYSSAMGDQKIVFGGEEAGDGVRVPCILIGEHEGVLEDELHCSQSGEGVREGGADREIRGRRGEAKAEG